MIHYDIPQRHGLKQAQQQCSQYKHICIEFIYEIIQLRLLQTACCRCAYLMCWYCVTVPATGHNRELHVKQEVRANFAAMSRDHVTEEDIETFTRVQDVALQVRRWEKKTSLCCYGEYYFPYHQWCVKYRGGWRGQNVYVLIFLILIKYFLLRVRYYAMLVFALLPNSCTQRAYLALCVQPGVWDEV